MNESHPYGTFIRRILLPLVIVAALMAATVIISGSALITIEDVQINRILAGTYGTPDWRVQQMNPLLAQLMALLYRIVPAVNWYGVMLLALLYLALSTAISMAARKPGGLIPAAIVLSPLAILLTYSLQSAVVCALCAASGALSLMDGVQRKKQGTPRAIVGGLLFAFAIMLDINWAVIIGVGAILCWMPLCLREERLRGIVVGLPMMAIIAIALFGYNALMYSSDNLSAYRENYALYERLQHSSLRDEQERLIALYGTEVYAEDHSGHDHDGDGIPDGESADGETTPFVIEDHVFDTVGWSINDATLFFGRNTADMDLLDPEVLKALSEEAEFFSFDIGRLAQGMWTTIKKPQFLLLIGLFIITAIALMVTTRRRGLVTLLATIIALGGHIVSILGYHDAFDAIAPFYLLSIIIMLFHFDGESAKAWVKRTIPAPGLRIGTACVALLGFAAVLCGLYYFTANTSVNPSITSAEAAKFLSEYIEDNKSVTFIGDNPAERVKPSALTAPVRGADENLLAGSYDLYSPRAAAIMEAHDLQNPLIDSLDREDVAYVSMAFTDTMVMRLIEQYNIYLKPSVDVKTIPQYREKIFRMEAYSQEELDAILAEIAAEEEQAAIWGEALQALDEEGVLDTLLPEADVESEPETTAVEPTAEPTEAPTEKPTAEPTKAPTAKPTAAPTVAPTKAPATTPTTRSIVAPKQSPSASPATIVKPVSSPVEATKAPGAK